MTDEELKTVYAITQEEVNMLREMCDVDMLSGVEIILNLSTIKILRHKLISLGYPPTLEGCMQYVGSKCDTSYIEAAMVKK